MKKGKHKKRCLYWASLLFTIALFTLTAPASVFAVSENTRITAKETTIVQTGIFGDSNKAENNDATYTIRWVVIDNGTEKVLETDTGLKRGEQPHFSGNSPSIEPDENYIYEFTGWSANKKATVGAKEANLKEVSGNITYYAIFRKVERDTDTKIVTWKDYDGTTLEIDTIENNGEPTFNAATPTREETERATYTFKGWSIAQDSAAYIKVSDLPKVTSDVVYYAVYEETPKTYTITWMNSDGLFKLSTQQVKYGETPVYNGTLLPTKQNKDGEVYTLIGWSQQNGIVVDEASAYITAPCTEDTTYYAVYLRVPQDYTLVQWLNVDKTVLHEEKVERGTSLEVNSYSDNPTYTISDIYDYAFTGWSEPDIKYDENDDIACIIYYAQYQVTPKKPTSFNEVKKSGVVVGCINGEHISLESDIIDGTYLFGDTVETKKSANDVANATYTIAATLTDMSSYISEYNDFNDGVIHAQPSMTNATITLTWDNISQQWVAPEKFIISCKCTKHNIKYSYAEDTPAEIANKHLISSGRVGVYAGTTVDVADVVTEKTYSIKRKKYVFAGWKLKTPDTLDGLEVDLEGYTTGTFEMPDCDVEFIGYWVLKE